MKQINWEAVALQNGYSHPGTGRNRFSKLRKAYEAAVAAGGVPSTPPPTPGGKKRGRKPKGWIPEEEEGSQGKIPEKEEGSQGKKVKTVKSDINLMDVTKVEDEVKQELV